MNFVRNFFQELPITIGEETWAGNADIPGHADEYTYAALVCDGSDTLHLVARYSGWGYRFQLVYMQKKIGSPNWTTFEYRDSTWRGILKHKLLVNPFRRFYSNWYHKLNIDRRGRLFVNYQYYAGNLFLDEAEAYRQKWPEDNIVKEDPNCPDHHPVDGHATYCEYIGVKPHGPAIIMSSDGGNTWYLATTEDFYNGIIR